MTPARSPPNSVNRPCDQNDQHHKNGHDNRIAKWEVIEEDSPDHGQEAQEEYPKYDGEHPLPRCEVVSVVGDIIVMLIGVGHGLSESASAEADVP